MGWTTYHRAKGQTHAEHFATDLNKNLEIIESSAKGGTFYAAVRNKETAEVFALVILFRWAPRDYYNFGTKWMDETVGPCEDEAPAKILDLLTPTDSKWANEWRERCRKNLEKAAEGKKVSSKVKDGDVIRVDKPLNFVGGGTAQEFRLEMRGRTRRWRANPGTVDGFMCRLPRDWATRYNWQKV